MLLHTRREVDSSRNSHVEHGKRRQIIRGKLTEQHALYVRRNPSLHSGAVLQSSARTTAQTVSRIHQHGLGDMLVVHSLAY